MPSPGYIPGPLVIPLTAQVRLLWQLPNGRAVTNVLHAIVPDGFVADTSQAETLYENIVTGGAIAAYFAFLSSLTSLQGVDIRDVRTPAQAAFESTAAATPGTGTLHALPEEVALVATLRTDLAGRAHRGRVYLTGFDASAIDTNGHAVADLTAAAQLFVASIADAMTALGLDLGIGHRGHAEYTNRLGTVVPAEAAGTDRVTAIIVRDNVFDSQRRRK